MSALDDVRRARAQGVEVSGRLDERVALANAEMVDDGHGGVIETWVPASPPIVYARIESMKGIERLQAQALEIELAYLVTMRWHAGVKAGTRITWGDHVLEVDGPPVELVRRAVLQCYCAERGAA